MVLLAHDFAMPHRLLGENTVARGVDDHVLRTKTLQDAPEPPPFLHVSAL